MVSKKEQAVSFYKAALMKFHCPICGVPYQTTDNLITCPNNHHITMAKQGSINLLSKHVKSDYTKEMLMHRRQVITSGLYNPVLDAITPILQEGLLLDAGCGEGSFLNYFHNPRLMKYGLDLSKEGIALATDYNQANQAFAVADLTKIPLQSQSVDYILNFLSPAMYQEFQRLLTPEGVLIKVIPGAYYLRELRQLVYHDTDNESYSNAKIKNHFYESINVLDHQQLTYTIDIDPSLKQDIVKMAPLTWNIDDEILNQLDLPKLTIDLEILIGQKK